MPNWLNVSRSLVPDFVVVDPKVSAALCFQKMILTIVNIHLLLPTLEVSSMGNHRCRIFAFGRSHCGGQRKSRGHLYSVSTSYSSKI